MRLLSVQSSLPAPVRRITSAEPLPAKAALQLVFLRARRTLKGEFSAVSYTHLTLPTNSRV